MTSSRAAIASPASVLEPGCRLCVCVQHPVWDAGKFVGPGPEATFVLGPTYFGPRPSAGTFERNGLSVTTRGRRLPIFLMLRLLKPA